MRRTHRPAVVTAAACLLVATLAACGGSTQSTATEPALVEGATTGGTLTIGISFDQPGLGLRTGDTYTGFDVETAKYVAKALGVAEDAITWKEADPADREDLLTSGAVDLVLSTYSITDERREVVDFAGPYLVAHQDLLVRRNDADISGPETLNGRRLCSVTGTTSSAYVKRTYKGRITLKEYGKFSDCVRALAASEVDAVTTDDVILAGYAAEPRYRGKLRVVGRGFTDERYGVGIPKGDSDLVEKVNAALRQYVDDGSWRRALEATVGPSGYDIPAPPTPGS